MIVPLVDEEEWNSLLSGRPTWSISKGAVLIIAPHPDDETLAAGGMIASLRFSGIEVIVAAVTDGENAYEDFTGLGEIRAKEQTAALTRLGVAKSDIFRLKLRDSDVASCEDALADLLRPLVERSTHVLAPWQHDFHPDHEVCGRVAERLAQEHGTEFTSYFFWTWHRGTTRSQ